jgi:hypothetical protein
MHIHRNDEAKRIVAFVGARRQGDFRCNGPVAAVAAVEDFALENPDRLAHAVGADVGD